MLLNFIPFIIISLPLNCDRGFQRDSLDDYYIPGEKMQTSFYFQAWIFTRNIVIIFYNNHEKAFENPHTFCHPFGSGIYI